MPSWLSQVLSSAIKRGNIDLLHDHLRLQVDLSQPQVAEQDEATLIDRVKIDNFLIRPALCEIRHVLKLPIVIIGCLILQDRLTEK